MAAQDCLLCCNTCLVPLSSQSFKILPSEIAADYLASIGLIRSSRPQASLVDFCKIPLSLRKFQRSQLDHSSLTSFCADYIPYKGDGFTVAVPSKWNPSKETEFPNVVLR